MKKYLLFALLITGSIALHVQYRKASFFTKNGKFIGFKTGANVFGKGVGTSPVFALVAGRDRGKNRVWHWFDIEYTMSSNFQYATTSKNSVNPSAPVTPLNISGKVSGYGVIRYNWVVNLLGKTRDDLRGQPFVKAALEIGFSTRKVLTTTYSPLYAAPLVDVTDQIALGAGFGVGYKYKLNDSYQIFGSAGYRFNVEPFNSTRSSDQLYFNTMPKHPYIGIGIIMARGLND